MAVTRTCDACGSSLMVERYSMQHKRRVSAEHSLNEHKPAANLSMGGIDLCGTCWESIAKPRQQQYVAGLTECDLCQSTTDTLRLTLKQSIREGGKVRDRGRGSIVLCLAHWELIGLPTMRRKADEQTDPVTVFLNNARRARA